MVRLMIILGKKILGKKSSMSSLDQHTLRKIMVLGKDKYVFSSVFPNEEIMRKVDAIMTEGER